MSEPDFHKIASELCAAYAKPDGRLTLNVLDAIRQAYQRGYDAAMADRGLTLCSDEGHEGEPVYCSQSRCVPCVMRGHRESKARRRLRESW